MGNLSDDDLDRIEATVLGPDGTAYGDDTLALVGEVRRLRAGIRECADLIEGCEVCDSWGRPARLRALLADQEDDDDGKQG